VPGGAERAGRGRRVMAFVRRHRMAVFCWVLVAVVVAVSVDVLVDGPLRQWDRWVMLGSGYSERPICESRSQHCPGLRLTSGFWFWVWRTVVWGGQYWLMALLAGSAALVQAVRRRRPWLLVAVGVWLAADQGVVWVFKKIFGRTFPASGVDRLWTSAEAYPSGHAALGASCLLVVAALVAGAGVRSAMMVAYVLSMAVGVSTVMLGYHWPTDAIAGWAFGILVGLFGVEVVRRFR
jgi:membrane-associated phospholipid phosphatase